MQTEQLCWIEEFPDNFTISQIMSHEVTDEIDEDFGQKILLNCEFADANSNDLLRNTTSSFALLRQLKKTKAFIACLVGFLLAPAVGFASTNLGEKVMVEMVTSKGVIKLELDAEKAPTTVANFIAYVKSGHFEGTIFHRVIPGFVIQGGGLESGMREKKTGAPIQNEADNGLKNLTGTICMARTNDPHSATSQFFINLKDNSFLDHTGKTPQGWGYAVFGRVTEGMDVVEAIAAVKTGNAGYHQDVPLEDIVIEKVSLAGDGQ